MENDAVIIAIPTQEISRIVQEKLFELGYKWKDHGVSFNENPVCKYKQKAYIRISDNEYIGYANISFYNNICNCQEITMYDLYQMKPIKDEVEVTIKVNGKEVNESLSIETAKNLGIIK